MRAATSNPLPPCGRRSGRLWRSRAGNDSVLVPGAAERNRHLSPEMKRAPAANPAGGVPRMADRPARGNDVEAATRVVLNSLEDDKAEDILAIDIRGKSSFADM